MKTRNLYNESGLQTKESARFVKEIEDAIRPIFDRYVKRGYSFRDLSHEAQATARGIELDYVLGINHEKKKTTTLTSIP